MAFLAVSGCAAVLKHARSESRDGAIAQT
jgi:hypothetical protein